MTDPTTTTRPAGADADAHALAARVSGPVLLPDDQGYEAERTAHQTAFRHRPSLIVGARDHDDVRAAVAYATTHGGTVAVQGSGHGLPVVTDGGLLINTRRMTGVHIDPAARTARIGAGTRWKQVILAAARYGLAPLSGSAPLVAAVPYTLGGGLGLLARQFGYASDHARGFDLVTADGELRHVDAATDAELFWALRGAGSSFGVVTGMEIGLVPVSRIHGGTLAFTGGVVEDVLQSYVAWTATLPEELTTSVTLMRFPDLPMFPAPLRGHYAAQIRIAGTLSARDCEQLIAPLRALGPRAIDSVRDMPYTSSGEIYSDSVVPHAYMGDNALLDGVDADTVRTILGLAGPKAAVMCVVELRHLGGALSREPAGGSAVGHRSAQYLLRVVSPLAIAPRSVVQPLHRRLFEAVFPRTIGRSPNFVYGDGTAPAIDGIHHAADAQRLCALKELHDPYHVFRFHHGIPEAHRTE
ncbi:FAD-binding oxidoreductase [Streptomyces sp. YGL11-2]|uniref:FAD-binding oxidoreductase n=1 Tax=Streptomyces sp. YGL11-2 TaxID=3414028 RepID=UPI003CF49810